VRVVLANEFSDINCPVTKLMYDLGAELALDAETTVIHANLRTKYRPGGTQWLRVVSLGLCHLVIPVVVLYQVLLSAIKREKICVVIATTPPLLHWNLLILSSVLRFHCVVWYQDAHPEIEVRILRRRGFSGLARVLSWLDRRILNLSTKVVVLDEAMSDLMTIDRRLGSSRVEISPPWSTFASPAKKMRQPHFSTTRVVSLIYAGNYGFTHDLSPLTEALSKLSAELKAQISITGIGMNPSSQALFRQLCTEAGIKVSILPRTESFHALLRMFDDYDLGVVSLRDDSAGLAAPSKAYTYISQGLPILYVGPKRTLPDSLVQRGFGVSQDSFVGAIQAGVFPILTSSGTIVDDPKQESMKSMMRVIND
jgi:hypothetical protein